jgi:hypothetical protein
MSDPYNIRILLPPETANGLRICIWYDVDDDTTVLTGEVLDRDERIVIESYRSWRGIRRNLALDTARVMARELEAFIDPF